MSYNTTIKTTRTQFLPFALPLISDDAIAEVTAVLRSGWITQGPKVVEFESKFAEYIGSKNAIAVNSATAGIHLALEAIGLSEKEAVITTAVTFTATVEAICYFNAQPILTDVDADHNNMTPALIEAAIKRECHQVGRKLKHIQTGKTVKAIIPVHLAGKTCDMEGIMALAKKYNLYVIEDAAHAFPAIHKDKLIGNWGDFTIFSFYATKGITTGEGGMITTNNSDMAKRIRLMRLHGINRDAYNRPGWYYEVLAPGFKYNMTDIAAALGVVQLKEANGFWARRRAIAAKYLQAFKDLQGVKLPSESSNEKHSWHLFRIEMDPHKANIGRDTFVEEMKDRNIGTSLHFIPIFEHPYYKKTYNFSRKNFKTATQMYDRSVSIPLFAGMTDEDVDDVIFAVRELLG